MLPRHPLLDRLPVSGLLSVTQTVVGCGVGLLLAQKLKTKAQRTTAITLLSLGLVTTLPVVVDYFTRQLNRPESPRSMKRRLASIRQDPGFSENADIY
ncbi:MAG: hypothetical protein QOD99_7 [Chthoniobacter sp.]|jgi:hypothetical protein|nr:hypothetical protein [Chthoniobacter sp.]